MIFNLKSLNASSQEIWFDWLNYVNPVLDEWTIIEDQTFNIWDNISKFNDFQEYANRTNLLLATIDTMNMTYEKDNKLYGKTYPEFFKVSKEYIYSLQVVINNLKVILDGLSQKSQNIEAYSYNEYLEDIKNYRESVETYHNLGDKMNLRFRNLN